MLLLLLRRQGQGLNAGELGAVTISWGRQQEEPRVEWVAKGLPWLDLGGRLKGCPFARKEP